MGVLGLNLERAGRATLMNQIGTVLGIPPGGWHGQVKLFEHGDIRLVGLLRMLANEHRATVIAANVGRAGRFTHANMMMAVVIAAREHDTALTASGTRPINTFDEGGLDFLGKQKNQLGLPRFITRNWEPLAGFESGETHKQVYPAKIPSRDQLLAYAAQQAASFLNNFKQSLRTEFGDDADFALTGASRGALLVWQAYTFLSPGGRPFDPKRRLSEQLDQHFGHRSALGFYAERARRENRKPSLDEILTDHSLDHLEWLHSAKTRAAETLFLERLLKRTREILPH